MLYPGCTSKYFLGIGSNWKSDVLVLDLAAPVNTKLIIILMSLPPNNVHFDNLIFFIFIY